MIQHIFTCGGYDFYRDGEGFWAVAHKGGPPPRHCGYATPEAIAQLKGVRLQNIDRTKGKTQMKKGDRIIYTVRGQDFAATVLRSHRDGTVTLRSDHYMDPDGGRGPAVGVVYKRVTPVAYRYVYQGESAWK